VVYDIQAYAGCPGVITEDGGRRVCGVPTVESLFYGATHVETVADFLSQIAAFVVGYSLELVEADHGWGKHAAVGRTYAC
jgi:hypothetical protein